MLGVIFLHLLAKPLEIRDITLLAYARGLAGIQEWRLVPINRPTETASLDHGLPSFHLAQPLAQSSFDGFPIDILKKSLDIIRPLQSVIDHERMFENI